jgi:hypothetical protein
MKRYLPWLAALLTFVALYVLQPKVTVKVGKTQGELSFRDFTPLDAFAQIISSSINFAQISGTVTPAQGGTGVTYGAPQTSLLTSASANYTVPTNATWLDICVASAGGGGGAATSGGSAAEAGGGGGGGVIQCGIIQAPSGTIAYTNQVGGTAGTCSGAPSAAGNATGTSTFGNYAAGNLAAAQGGATASAVAGGAGGNGATTTINTAAVTQIYLATGAGAGTTGVGKGDVLVLGGQFSGATGGSSATVTASGVCHLAATNGANGFIVVKAYFN